MSIRLCFSAMLSLVVGATASSLSAATPVTAPVDSYFDAATTLRGYRDGFKVVGAYTPVSWSWGKIELLEGTQKFRTEGYNLRTQKTRYQDTYEDSTYPLRTYFGELNQEIVDGFNLYYQSACAGSTGSTSAPSCLSKGPTRPEARLALLHYGPLTAKGQCDSSKSPVLLVHGAMQNANVWLYPSGNDGAGHSYPDSSGNPTPLTTGLVQRLEQEGYCTYAVTFGNFHGDNYSQAIHVANALQRVKRASGRTRSAKVNVVAWSKGVLPVDLYTADASSWTDWGSSYFEQIAMEQARQVPAFRKDVRTYVALSGPHMGIDLNFRHPYDDLLIYSTLETAPIGQGPVTWSWMSAMQCVTWGYVDSPSNPIYPNPYAYSVCEGRGGTWPDFWTRIYSSNLVGLDPEGHPLFEKSLRTLNVEQGVKDSSFSFDQYNMAMFGSVDESGRFVSAYLGQMQATYDLRDWYPTPQRNYSTQDWSTLDTDKYKWYDWMNLKVTYLAAGAMVDALVTCRNTAFEPSAYPCRAKHTYYNKNTADSYSGGYATYQTLSSIGIDAVMEMGGNFIERLARHSLSSSLDFLYVLYGTTPGPEGAIFEFDGMEVPYGDPHGDGVLFDISVAARDQLTSSWMESDRAVRSLQEGMPFSHLELGVTPAVWEKLIFQFNSLP